MTSKFTLATQRIMEIKPYVPGSYASAGEGKKLIKLSSNENPFGCSSSVVMAVNKELANLNRYPEGGATALRNKLAQLHNIDADRIICGAGSDELITLVCMAYGGPDAEVLYTKHGFLMYPISALSVGSKPVVADEKDLKADVDEILKKVTDKTRILFLANPNNPTGSYLNEKELWRLVKGLPKHVVLVLDMAYAEYATAADYPDAIKLVNEFDNVIMMRTFSKAYGIPGLRLGWAYASDNIIDILNRVRGPFNTSSLAQVAGIAALADQEFVKRSVEHNTKWLGIMKQGFEELGLKPYPSVANFILVDFGAPEKAAAADEYLRECGISGRRMDAYQLASCMRFTIGQEEENKALLEALAKFLNV